MLHKLTSEIENKVDYKYVGMFLVNNKAKLI